jgi:AcrR family transcriptional regulator
VADQRAPKTKPREHILDVALDLMSEHGFAGTSMRQLAQACGVQVAAIYHYFPSKDALLSSVFEERRYSARLDEQPIASDPSTPFEDRIRSVFELFWRGALEEEKVLRLLLGEAIRNEPVAMPTGASLLEVFRSGVATAIEELLPEVEEPKVAAELVVAQVFSGFIRHLFDPSASPDLLAEQHAEILVAALHPIPRAAGGTGPVSS